MSTSSEVCVIIDMTPPTWDSITQLTLEADRLVAILEPHACGHRVGHLHEHVSIPALDHDGAAAFRAVDSRRGARELSQSGAELTRQSASMSSQHYSGSFLASSYIDSNMNIFCHSNSDRGYRSNPWLSIALSATSPIGNVVVYNRNGCCQERFATYEVWVGSLAEHRGTLCGGATQAAPATNRPFTTDCGGASGRYVTIRLRALDRTLDLAEVKVYSPPPPPPSPSPPLTTPSTVFGLESSPIAGWSTPSLSGTVRLTRHSGATRSSAQDHCVSLWCLSYCTIRTVRHPASG